MDGSLTTHQTLFAVATAVVVMLVLLDLVRRRRVREEYVWLWLVTGAAMIVLVSWYRLLVFVTWAIGAVTPLNTLLIFSTLFLLAIVVHYSVIISRLTTQVKNLAQEVALLSARLDRAPGPSSQSPGTESPAAHGAS